MSTVLSTPQQLPVDSTRQDQLPNWKQQLAERLDAYRAKHPETTSASISPNISSDSRASRIARSVASRYAASPTYSELLRKAAQAERAAAEARAALAERQEMESRFAAEQDAYAQMDRETSGECPTDKEHCDRDLFQSSSTDQTEVFSSDAERTFTERYGSPVTQPATAVMPQFAARTGEMHLHRTAPEPEPTFEDLWESALVEPRTLLPSKLIEFPRELVSSRRARPRLPEGPAYETDTSREPEAAQLRIFEVLPEEGENRSEVDLAGKQEPVSVSSQVQSGKIFDEKPGVEPQNILEKAMSLRAAKQAVTNRAEANAPVQMPVSASSEKFTYPGRDSNNSSARAFKRLEWASISLDKEPGIAPRRSEASVADCVPFLVDPAPIDRRLMAFAVDFAAVTAGFLGFLLVFAASAPHLPTGIPAAVLAGVVYVALWVLYQMLFFSLSGATAGMLYARIALCTFDDQNPTRIALRRRLAAWWLSCLPLGIGFLWSFVDEDNLSWHDRMTRMYQRGY